MRRASAIALFLLAAGLPAAEPAAPLTLAQAARRALAGNLGIGLERLGAAAGLLALLLGAGQRLLALLDRFERQGSLRHRGT